MTIMLRRFRNCRRLLLLKLELHEHTIWDGRQLQWPDWPCVFLLYDYDIYCTGECSSRINKNQADSSDITEHPRDGKPRPYLCTVCDKRFRSKTYMNVHRKRHTGENMFSCTQCGKRFSSKSGLREHMNIHRGKYKCTKCGKCCQRSRDLARHRRSHSGEKPFKCTYCLQQTIFTGWKPC